MEAPRAYTIRTLMSLIAKKRDMLALRKSTLDYLFILQQEINETNAVIADTKLSLRCKLDFKIKTHVRMKLKNKRYRDKVAQERAVAIPHAGRIDAVIAAHHP